MYDPIDQRDDLLIINKHSGTPVLRDRSGAPCLWDRLKAEFGRVYLVHRLDKGTSGVMLIARSQTRQRSATRAFANRLVHKFYVARVVGNLSLEGTGILDLPLRKGRKSRYRVAAPRASIRRDKDQWSVAGSDGHASVTRIRVLATSTSHTVLCAQPVTGRTHQLRVHLSWIGHPIVGDHLYGKPDDPDQAAPRLALHCHKLALPGIGVWRAPVPAWD